MTAKWVKKQLQPSILTILLAIVCIIAKETLSFRFERTAVGSGSLSDALAFGTVIGCLGIVLFGLYEYITFWGTKFLRIGVFSLIALGLVLLWDTPLTLNFWRVSLTLSVAGMCLGLPMLIPAGWLRCVFQCIGMSMLLGPMLREPGIEHVFGDGLWMSWKTITDWSWASVPALTLPALPIWILTFLLPGGILRKFNWKSMFSMVILTASLLLNLNWYLAGFVDVEKSIVEANKAMFLYRYISRPDKLRIRGKSPVVIAVHAGQVEMARFLTKLPGLAPGPRNTEQIEEAIKVGDFDLVKHLMETHPIRKKHSGLINKAASHARLDCLDYFIEKGLRPSQSSQCHLFPARVGRLDYVKKIVEAGADVRSCDAGNFIEIADYLLKKGAHIDYQGGSKRSALHNAAELRNLDMVKFLLRKNAPVNQEDFDYQTPLHLSCKNRLSHRTQIRLKDLCKSPWYGGTESNPVSARKVEKQLASFGINTERWKKQPSENARRMEICRLLLKAGANVNQQDRRGMTALHFAALASDVPLVRLLLAHGADATIEDNMEQRTPYQMSIYQYGGRSEVKKELAAAFEEHNKPSPKRGKSRRR